MARNIGEWSEFYTLLKILADGHVAGFDGNLKPISGVTYDVSKILRREKEKDLLIHTKKGGCIKSIDKKDGRILKTRRVLANRIENEIETILLKMKESKREKGTFDIPSSETLKDDLGLSSIKAPAKCKEDIILEINDKVTNQSTQVGFSIKSYFGATPTLLNSGKLTRFSYLFKNFKGDMDEINGDEDPKIGKYRRRIKSALAISDSYEFARIRPSIKGDKTFERNLQSLELQLPEILASMVWIFFTTDDSSVPDLVSAVIARKKEFKLHPSLDEKMLEIKLKHLLMNSAMGMVASKPWAAKFSVDGGFLIVSSDGELGCFHVYNLSDLAEYLYKNTKFDTPSASSNKSDYGYLYENDGRKAYIDLALQIRFSVPQKNYAK